MTQQIPFRALALSVLRMVMVVAVLIGAYLVVPIHPESPVTSAVVWASLLALVALIGVFLHQTRRINRSNHPMLAGAETLIIVLAIFVVGFSFVYLSMSTSAPDTFSEPLNRAGAFYFTMTVLSTVGFGDITPKTDLSRWLVSAQMGIGIGFLAGALRLIFGIAKRADQRHQVNPETSTGADA